MPMKLDASCQCGGVEFTLQSQTPVPYQFCACSICRKMGGYSGSVNIGGLHDSLQILKGLDLIKRYNAISDRGTPHEKKLQSERAFCSVCSSPLWVFDRQWPELVHPFASVIDTPLPAPKEMVCVKGDSKPEWLRWPDGEKSVHRGFGPDSLEEWHRKRGLFVE